MGVSEPIKNYRVEKVSNGFVLHCTQGKDGALEKVVFTNKTALIEFLQEVL